MPRSSRQAMDISFTSVVNAEDGGTGKFRHTLVLVKSLRKKGTCDRSERVATPRNTHACLELADKGIELPTAYCCQCSAYEARKATAGKGTRLWSCSNNRLDNADCPLKLTCESMWRRSRCNNLSDGSGNKRQRCDHTPQSDEDDDSVVITPKPTPKTARSKKRSIPPVSPLELRRGLSNAEQVNQSLKDQVASLEHQVKEKNNVIDALQNKVRTLTDQLNHANVMLREGAPKRACER